MDDAIAPATAAVHLGRPPADPGNPLSPPVQLSSTFHAAQHAPEPGLPAYGRFANANWAGLEEALGGLEGGTATVFASGMAAIAAVFEQVPVGGTLVLPVAAYSNTISLARELESTGRLRLRLVRIGDLAAVTEAVAGADVAVLESPTNPLLEVGDLPAVAAAKGGCLLAVDNTFNTPLTQRPLEFGADLVVHSATKYLSGHSDVMLGAVVTNDEALHARIVTQRSLRGALPGPVETWLALRGLRTLHLRVERATANAAELARRLARHPALETVRYPGLGAIVSVDVAGGAAGAEALCAGVRLWAHATSLGGVESTLERRRRHAAESDAVPPGLVRLSVGIEDVEDLWRDLAHALDRLVSP